MANKQRIQSLSRFMAACCILVMVALPSLIAWYWLTFAEHIPELQARFPDTLIAIEYISSSQILIAALVSLTPIAILAFALWQLRQLFTLFASGVVFSNSTTARLHLFGKALFASAIVSPIAQSLLSVVLTWGNPPGQRTLMLCFGSNEIALLMLAATFLIITWVFREGQRLSHENAEFV